MSGRARTDAVEQRLDLLVLGAGPAGHKAAIQAAKAGKRVLIVDRDPSAGARPPWPRRRSSRAGAPRATPSACQPMEPTRSYPWASTRSRRSRPFA